MESLSGKRVLVVGASSGIGRAIGVAIAKHGGRVAFAARRVDRCEQAAREAGNDAIAVACDVSDQASCAAAVRATAEAFGGIDAFVYAAGVSPLARLADVDVDTWRTVFDTNVIGANLICRAALPHLRESGGRAVFLSSSSVGRPYPALAVYASSKAALEETIRGWRSENPDLSFSCVVVGPTDGTEFAVSWDLDETMKTLEFWEKHGYDAAAIAMNLDEIASVVVHTLLLPVSVHNVTAFADPTRDTRGES